MVRMLLTGNYMMKRMARWLMLAVVLLTSGAATGATVKTDTLSIRFRLDSIRIDMGYGDNAKAWAAFEDHFRSHFAHTDSIPLCVDIYSGASPEGPASHNRWLGENRGLALQRLVRRMLGTRRSRFVIHNEGARWNDFYNAVAASSEPWRDEVLRIISLPPSSDESQLDHREQKLRALRGGSVWPVLLRDYLAPLRSGATAVLSFQSARDTVFLSDTIIMAVTMRPCDEVPAAPTAAGELPRKPVVRQPVWIWRTNIPMLAALTPNMQLEFSLGHKDKWSLNIEGAWSWWTFSYNAYANEIIFGSLEVRRWLGARYRHHTLDGWHLGLGIGGGYGDLEWRSRGYQAEVATAFLNLGWQGRFGRRKQWAFDAGVGVGYAYVPWRRYKGSTLFPVGKEEVHDDHLMWQEKRRMNWIGPVHANISIGYVFNQRDAAWKRHKALERDADRYGYLHFRDSMKAREVFERDSARTARKLRLKEIDLMPRAERRQALQQLAAEDKDVKQQKRFDKRREAIEAKEFERQEKAQKKLARQQQRDADAAHKRENREMREWANTPEGRAAVRQMEAEEKEQRRQAKIDAKAAKKQAKLDRKLDRVKARMDAKHRRHLEKLQREMEKADGKYSIK